MAVCIGNLCIAQQKDTILVKNQKGFLFLTDYNYQYDWREGDEMRPLGFHDFFFPAENFNCKLLIDSARHIAFNNGIRIDFMENRKALKAKARVFKGKDTSGCYGFDQFYLMPVIIDYKKVKEYEPYVCRRNYFDIKVDKGSSLHFEYLHEAIKPTKIVVQRVEKKGKPKGNRR